MTMHVNLSPEMERYIKSKVSGGFYGNGTEVIRDAIRRMQSEEAVWRHGRQPSPKVKRNLIAAKTRPTRQN